MDLWLKNWEEKLCWLCFEGTLGHGFLTGQPELIIMLELTLVELLALWFLVSVPLTFVGAFLGFRKRAVEHPVRTNQIPRQIPDQSFYTHVS